MEKVLFAVNVPQEFALRYTQGRPSESKFGAGMQALYSTTDGRAFYVSETAGQAIDAQLAEMEIQPGEVITITKAEVAQDRGRKAIRWIVARVSDAMEPQPPRKAPQAVAAAPALAPTGTDAAPVSAARLVASSAPHWTQVLLDRTTHLIDVYVAAVEHAATYKGVVKPDAVQSMMISAFIDLTKQGGGR